MTVAARLVIRLRHVNSILIDGMMCIQVVWMPRSLYTVAGLAGDWIVEPLCNSLLDNRVRILVAIGAAQAAGLMFQPQFAKVTFSAILGREVVDVVMRRC
jgi:hypothetical protein